MSGSQFPCKERLVSGKACTASFPRAWNLKRHLTTQHKPATTFVDCAPGAKRKRWIHQGDGATLTAHSPALTAHSPALTAHSPALTAHSPAPGTPESSRMLLRRYGASSPARSSGISANFSPSSALSLDQPSIASTVPSVQANELGSTRTASLSMASDNIIGSYAASDDADTPDIYPEKRVRRGSFLPEGEELSTFLDTPVRSPVLPRPPDPRARLDDHNAPNVSSEPTGVSKPTIHRYGRNAALRDPIPAYEVKLSKSFTLQQRGIEWLSSEAKTVFDERYAALLSRWGVKPEYQDTCILVPEEWRLADPSDLYTYLDKQGFDFPSFASSRSFYSYSDHTTTLARAKAWFAQWPRRGVELDNFLECGPFQPMDASHRCHHDHCIVHMTYEGADTNIDRCECQRYAKFLRQEGREVPEHCNKHNPPCLMQHASLTRRESYGIQFDVLSAAQGLPAQPPVGRTRRYPFPTFEGRLPTSFSALKLNKDMLVSQPLERKNPARPNIVCQLCTTIRSFASISGFWVHIFTKHEGLDASTRLEEMHRAAGLWRTYRHSSGRKHKNATQSKLEQMENPGFGWDDVIAWKLH